jgi:hypothetical protein
MGFMNNDINTNNTNYLDLISTDSAANFTDNEYY